MLEVRNLRKEYRTKNGAITKALDGVSLTFPETGMIFILGKSGSGKSTLLNICGGLDKADSGEIIIKGKSSAEFTGPDFDSYRNTYVGFVFQEYNILEEFTVEENIGLALELQGKKRDPEAIAQILGDVEMTEFASRKPNTLSGGQKQRVAIARALVKQPEIIMADEPTGALDSKTGEQVFDTLKKLSNTKLVLVISHDRDFAEQYGDRIIELKDGKVISDQARVEKAHIIGESNVRFYGNDTVCVTDGSKLTDEDLNSIKNFLGRAGGSAVISTSRDNIAKMKADKPEMNVGEFEPLAEQPKSPEYPPQQLIRSHLPLRHAVRMGASGLKTKPGRLVFTIFLSVIAFIMFGLASTLMLFDGRQMTIQTFADIDDKYMILSKSYYEKTIDYRNGEYFQEYENKRSTVYTADEYRAIAERYPGTLAVLSPRTGMEISGLALSGTASQFYSSAVNYLILADSSLQLESGRLPTADDEIAISRFLYDGITSRDAALTMLTDDNNYVEKKITDYSNLFYSNTNKVRIAIKNAAYKVVGVFKACDYPSDYAELKGYADRGEVSPDRNDEYMWERELRSNVYASIAATENVVRAYGTVPDSSGNGDHINDNDYFYSTYGNAMISIADIENASFGNGMFGVYYMAKYGDRTNILDIYDLGGNKISSVPDGGVAASARNIVQLFARSYKDHVDYNRDFGAEADRLENIADEAEREYVALHPAPTVSEFTSPTGEFDNVAYNAAMSAHDSAVEYVRENAKIEASNIKEYLLFEKQTKERARNEYAKLYPPPTEANELFEWSINAEAYVQSEWSKVDPVTVLSDYSDEPCSREKLFETLELAKQLLPGCECKFVMFGDYALDPKPVNIVAIFFEEGNYSAYLGGDLFTEFYVPTSDDTDDWTSVTTTKYKMPEDAYITYLFVPYRHDTATVTRLVDMTYARADDDTTVTIQNEVMSEINMFEEMAQLLWKVFLAVGLVLALFSFLLMFNFISASIAAKKKDIGILRAIGARTADVFKIFLAEATIIALICFVLSSIGAFGVCALLNSIITDGTLVHISVFVFGPLSVLCIFGIAIVTAVLSTLIPVGMYSKKPPIASIRSL